MLSNMRRLRCLRICDPAALVTQEWFVVTREELFAACTTQVFATASAEQVDGP